MTEAPPHRRTSQERCLGTTGSAGHRTHRIGWLRAAVLGVNDGIVSTASLVVGVGVAAAEGTRGNVLVAGVAGLVAGAMSIDGRRRVCLGELSRYRKGPTRMASARNSRMFADRERNPGATDLDADRLHEPRDAMIDMIDHSQDHAKPHEAQMPPNSQFVARGFRKRTQKKLCPFHSC